MDTPTYEGYVCTFVSSLFLDDMDYSKKTIQGGVHLSTVAFLSLLALFILPWVLLAVHTHEKHPELAASQALSASTNQAPCHPPLDVREGPWGRLTLTPLTISPTDESLPPGWSRPSPTTWLFPGHTPVTLKAFLGDLKLFADEKTDLLDTTRWKTETDGVRVFPKPDTILSLDQKTRLAIYAQLARHPDNRSYQRPWSIKKSAFASALAASDLAEETRQLIERVSYVVSNRVFVADAASVVGFLNDEEEKIRAIQFLKSAETYVVDLNIQPGDALINKLSYWGDQTSQKSIRPILESMTHSEDGGHLDIIHVLPAFARDHLYTYPDPAQAADGIRRDCHWSSLNFFSTEPDDQFGASAYVQQYVVENFYQSADAPAFGDIIFFTTRDGETVHSATYLAANLSFTKNGDDVHQPWIIMDVNDLEELYSSISLSPVTRQVWKRKAAGKG